MGAAPARSAVDTFGTWTGAVGRGGGGGGDAGGAFLGAPAGTGSDSGSTTAWSALVLADQST